MTDHHDNEVAVLQKELQTDMRASLEHLGPAMISSKIQQHQILSQSAAAGGPTSAVGAVQTLLDYTKVGVRPLSQRIGVKRKILQQMISGERDMPAEVISNIWDAIEVMRPGVLDKLMAMDTSTAD
jgi:hypothetical protein